MRIARVRVALCVLVGLAVLTLGGCPAPEKAPVADPVRQDRVDAAHAAEIQTLQARLNQERQAVVTAQARADLIDRDLQAERNRREQERLQYDEALRQNQELKKKMEDMRLDSREIATLRQDVTRLGDMVKQRDAEIERLKSELDALKGAKGK